MQITLLTPAEEALMLHLWELGEFRVKDILSAYGEEHPHPNTISTYLKILVEKNFLSQERTGRIFQYRVAIPKMAYAEFLWKVLFDNYLKSDSALAQEFLQNQGIFDQKSTKLTVSETPLADEILKKKKKSKKKSKK